MEYVHSLVTSTLYDGFRSESVQIHFHVYCMNSWTIPEVRRSESTVSWYLWSNISFKTKFKIFKVQRAVQLCSSPRKSAQEQPCAQSEPAAFICRVGNAQLRCCKGQTAPLDILAPDLRLEFLNLVWSIFSFHASFTVIVYTRWGRWRQVTFRPVPHLHDQFTSNYTVFFPVAWPKLYIGQHGHRRRDDLDVPLGLISCKATSP